MAEYGFLGLGIMGAPMAATLIRAGHGLTVWNRTAQKCDALVQLGAKKGAYRHQSDENGRPSEDAFC